MIKKWTVENPMKLTNTPHIVSKSLECMMDIPRLVGAEGVSSLQHEIVTCRRFHYKNWQYTGGRLHVKVYMVTLKGKQSLTNQL